MLSLGAYILTPWIYNYGDMTNNEKPDSRSGERLRVLHTTSARRLPDVNSSTPRSRRLFPTRPRASLLSTDSRYLAVEVRLVVCVG